MSKKFEIEVIEVLSRVVEVEALDSADAIENVKKMHEDGDIVLDWKDYDNMPTYQNINLQNPCFNCDVLKCLIQECNNPVDTSRGIKRVYCAAHLK